MTSAHCGVGPSTGGAQILKANAASARVTATDPLTFLLVAGLLVAVSAVACAIPAMRAARIDPMLVLREQ